MKKKEKSRFAAGMRADWKGMQLWSNDNLCKLDWMISTLLLLFLFVTFLHGDTRLTGNRSFLMFDHFTDFYEASHEMTGRYDANYMPSTFLAFAIWNLPLYLLGHVPEDVMTNSFINNMWYKLLPVLLYYVTSHLLYKIGLEMGFGEKKARLCKFAFLVFPIGVFSQFIFGQYDIFTVSLMVLGLYFYVRGKMWGFTAAFAFAITFKYHAVLYFLVLLILKEKKIRNLLKYGIVVVIPIGIEVAANIHSESFRRGVLNFTMLKNVQNVFSLGFVVGINLVAAACAFVLVWAYQKKVRDEQELYSWMAFFTTAISFAVFGFSSWNPQWLLLIVPFVLLNIFINENSNMLVMITNILIVALYIFASQNMVNERIIGNGILKYILPNEEFPLRMWDVYPIHNEELLGTAIWVVLLVYVVFGHPRYHNQKRTAISRGFVWQIRSAFLVSVFAFTVPAMACVVSQLQGGVVFFDNSVDGLQPDNFVMVDNDTVVTQEFRADGTVLNDIQLRVYNRERYKFSSVEVKLKDKKTGEVLCETSHGVEDFQINSSLYSFVKGEIPVEPGRMYVLELTGDAQPGQGIGIYCRSTESNKELMKTSAVKEGTHRLQMRVTGKK